MKLVHFYLNFPGNAREAFECYASIFKTKIVSVATFGEAPFAGTVAEAAKDKIMNIQLPITDMVHLMGSDSLPGVGPPLRSGNNFHISVVAEDQARADEAFAALSRGGSVEMPLGNAPWGVYFGMCTDRFGIQWMVSLDHSV